MRIPENVRQKIEEANMVVFRHDSRMNEAVVDQILEQKGLSFIEGAEFGFQKGYELAIERLRNARHNDGIYVGAAKAKDMHKTADWLEEWGEK